VNDDALKVCGSIRVALTPLSHQGADGARSPAGAVAADRVLPAAKTVLVTGTDDAGVELGELTLTVDTAPAPQAGVEHGAVGVELARRGTTLTLATFRAGQALDDRRGADTLDAGIQDARIIVLTAAVAMVRARGHTATVGAELVLGATARADLLSDNLSPRPTDEIGRDRR
jgi:hypothetical protein